MAIISLFAKSNVKRTEIRRKFSAPPSPIFLDATLKESLTATAEPTKHPVENGADVTDHVILHPATLAISGIITETPFPSFLAGLLTGLSATVASTIGAALGPFGAAAGAVVGATAGSSLASSIFGTRDRDLGAVVEEFEQIRKARQPFDIQTGLKLYKDYLLASFTVNRTDKTGGSIQVDLQMEELLLVNSQNTSVVIPKVKGALGQSNHGGQSKEALSGAETGAGSSLLKKLSGFVTGG